VPRPGRIPPLIRAPAATIALCATLLGTALVSSSAGDLQSRIAADQSAASSLRSQIAADSAEIGRTSAGLGAAERRLGTVERQLTARETQLYHVQSALLNARAHLLYLENRLHAAASALAANLLAQYEGQQPDLISAVLEAHGFTDLLERVNFIERIGHQDADVVATTRTARTQVQRQATALAALEQRDRAIAEQVLAQRNEVAALQAALLRRRLSELRARGGAASRLSSLNATLRTLEARAAAQAARAAATGNASVGGIAIDTGGMVQPPPGAPAAVREVIAAGNAIATLPYIYGGGHASFQANGYDCSGSVSYALAAAGLVTSPMVSGQFEDWGDPGPGRWITVYANAGHVWMEVAGWRFDTVALAEIGTRWARGGGEFSGFVVRHPPGL
jgi:peptidoglycan hydrolase CwlO-like protein